MKNIAIVGGSRGIGNAVLLQQLQSNRVYNLSRTAPDAIDPELFHFSVDVLQDKLPELEELDTLIYCPGSINLKPIQSLTIDDFRHDFEINVMGAVKTIQKYLPVLRKGKDPSILLFSTVASRLGMPFHASVAASKSAVEGLVKSLGAELSGQIRVNAIAPTITETALSASILRNERMKENMKERHPMKNYLQADEVAQMANYLISENARSVSGQIFAMDYGLVSFKL